MAGTARFGNIRFTWVKAPSQGMGPDCFRRADLMLPTTFEMLEELSQDIVDYMKANAPWQNRTGNARAGLSSNANVSGSAVSLTAYHTVPYGGFLETGTSRMSAYPIIGPALQAHYGAARTIMNQIAGKG